MYTPSARERARTHTHTQGAKLAAGRLGVDLGDGVFKDEYEVSWLPSRDFRHHSYPACVRVADTLGSRSAATGAADPAGVWACVCVGGLCVCVGRKACA